MNWKVGDKAISVGTDNIYEIVAVYDNVFIAVKLLKKGQYYSGSHQIGEIWDITSGAFLKPYKEKIKHHPLTKIFRP